MEALVDRQLGLGRLPPAGRGQAPGQTVARLGVLGGELDRAPEGLQGGLDLARPLQGPGQVELQLGRPTRAPEGHAQGHGRLLESPLPEQQPAELMEERRALPAARDRPSQRRLGLGQLAVLPQGGAEVVEGRGVVASQLDGAP